MRDEFDYPAMVQRALHGVVREALTRVAESGLPGQHHFYVSFRTRHPGVEVPDYLRARHPDEMTIVLQHKFWGLEVGDDMFAVTLTFQGRSERLVVPYAALTGFADPSVNFGLRLGGDTVAAEQEPPPEEAPAEDGAADPAPPAGETPASGSVVSLDSFRKK